MVFSKMNQQKIFPKHISDEEILFRVYKELFQLTNKIANL